VKWCKLHQIQGDQLADHPGDLIGVDPPQFYGLLTRIKIEPTVATANAQSVNVVHLIFDCFRSGWYDTLKDDPAQWPALTTVARLASSRMIEVILTQVELDTVNQRAMAVSQAQIPPLLEGTWWWLKLATDFEPAPYIASIGYLPVADDTNPVSVVFSGLEERQLLVDLMLPQPMARLRHFSHGWAFLTGVDIPGLL
jgi:hypothetical protein